MLKLLETVFTYRQVLADDPDVAQVSVAIAKRDFGPWKKGDEVPLLALCTDYKGDVFLEAYDESGEKRYMVMQMELSFPPQAMVSDGQGGFFTLLLDEEGLLLDPTGQLPLEEFDAINDLLPVEMGDIELNGRVVRIFRQ